MRRRYAIFLGIVLLLASTIVLSSEEASIVQGVLDRDSIVVAREVHDPILITSNSDFLEQKEANNWTGTGEPHDPITIADYRIEFSDQGITIKNVDLHWAIINCETGDYDAQYTFSKGIYILNCTNGAIEYSVAHMKETGIYIDDSRYITLYENTVHDCATGVTISRSRNIVVDSNNLGWNDWLGLNMTLTDECAVTNNAILSVPYYGISCIYDRSTFIAGNEITSTYLEDEYNEFENVGVFNYGSWNYVLQNNHIHECAIGLEMWLANGSFVCENQIGNSTDYSIFIGDGSINVTVVDNYIGPTNGINAYDAGEENHWDDPYSETGNYWTDYNGTGYYYIPGPAGSIDHYPQAFTSGNFTVTSPEPTDVTSTTPDTTDTTPDTTDTTNGTDDDGEFRPLIMAISVGSSLIIVVLVVLIFRSSRAP